MSLKRHTPARGFEWRIEQDYASPPHWHAWDQLTFAADGSMHIRGDDETWLVTAGRAIWIPARLRHAEHVQAPAAMTTLYLPAGIARHMPKQLAMIAITPLSRALIAHIASLGELNQRTSSHVRLLRVLIDHLNVIPDSLQLPMPRDPRARAVADRLRAQPGDDSPLPALGRHAGASGRTIERLFLAETGMTIGDWRRQLRLQHGVQRLARGASVNAAAREAGYASPSAFIAAFRRQFGTTPRRY